MSYQELKVQIINPEVQIDTETIAKILAPLIKKRLEEKKQKNKTPILNRKEG